MENPHLERLVCKLEQDGSLRTPRIKEAFLHTPRHVFLPGKPVEEVYSDDAIVTKRDPKGRALSSSSQPSMMALMLEQLGANAGDHILEVGAGVGYNAGLLANIVGPSGRVVSVEVDEDLAPQARRNLGSLGLANVEVIQGDGTNGWPPGAPYDRMIVTAGASDLPPAWFEQLKPGGVLVCPLQIRTTQESTAFRKEQGRLVSISFCGCGFMSMRGALATTGKYHHFPDGLQLYGAEKLPAAVDGETLQRWLHGPGERIPTGIRTTLRELFGPGKRNVLTWLTWCEASFYRLCLPYEKFAQHPLAPWLWASDCNGSVCFFDTWASLGEHGMVTLSALGDRTVSPTPPHDTEPFEFMVCVFGQEPSLVENVLRRLKQWRESKGELELTATLRDAAETAPAGDVHIERTWTRLTVGHS